MASPFPHWSVVLLTTTFWCHRSRGACPGGTYAAHDECISLPLVHRGPRSRGDIRLQIRGEEDVLALGSAGREWCLCSQTSLPMGTLLPCGAKQMVHSKRLGYQNSYAEDLRLSLHTDNPQLLQLPKLLYVIGPQQREGLRVNFQPKPRTMVRHCCHYRCAFPRQRMIVWRSHRVCRRSSTRKSDCGSITSARTRMRSASCFM